MLTGMDAHVLLEVKESKRAIVLHRNGREEAIQRAVESIDSSIHVVFDRKEDVPANTVPYILQRYSAEWNEFLDVTNCDVDLILDRDRLQAIPSPSVIKTSAEGQEPSTSVSVIIKLRGQSVSSSLCFLCNVTGWRDRIWGIS